MIDWQGSWLWTSESTPKRNAFVRFRKRIEYQGGEALLNITADSRYILYVNGELVGRGPIREWPSHWKYDVYDLKPFLQTGTNVIAALVNHFGDINYQYIPGPPGLLAKLEIDGGVVTTDDTWLASPDLCYESCTPRIGVSMAFEEQFDARLYDGWQMPGYNDSAWKPALVFRPAQDGWHENMEPRDIPFLTMEPVMPVRVVSKDVVRSLSHLHNIWTKPYLLKDPDSHPAVLLVNAHLVTQIWVPFDVEVNIVRYKGPGWPAAPMKINSQEVPFTCSVKLHAGWNSVVISIRSIFQLLEFVFCVDGPEELRFCSTGDTPGSPWAVVGPFELGEKDLQTACDYVDNSPTQIGATFTEATCAEGDAFWASGEVAGVVDKPYFQQVRSEHLPKVDVMAMSFTERTVGGKVLIENEEGLLSGADWAVVYPSSEGDVRILLDFGKEIIGYHSFEVMADAGTVIDFLSFEFIQPDGRRNFLEDVNVTKRYICRDGRQSHLTYTPQGFRYSYIIIRNQTGPVRLRNVRAIFSTYPQANRGSFACSDVRLSKIWEVGAHTLRCSSIDTYIDSPGYEQVHWMGDARNEAPVDWVINGDNRLWYRYLTQAGRSLERSPMVECHVPSLWSSIIPAWSFMWMRSCKEYLQHTGDRKGSLVILDFLKQNIDGLDSYIDRDGLFDIRAWNLADWAAVDCPWRGVVAHQNCHAVLALRDAAQLASWLGRAVLEETWNIMADSLAIAINSHLWNGEKQAYTDCIRDGKHSTVYSQQTQILAYLSGTAAGKRAERCLELIKNPPDDFVKVGSQFFEFMKLEAHQKAGDVRSMLEAMRRDWGFMIDAGATTFWEHSPMRDIIPDWELEEATSSGRLVRSACHGWAAGPTYFLSTYVLGVYPSGPDCDSVIIAPNPGDLSWCRGSVPTPKGDIQVQWDNRPDHKFSLEITCPECLDVIARLPREGIVVLNGKVVQEKGTR